MMLYLPIEMSTSLIGKATIAGTGRQVQVEEGVMYTPAWNASHLNIRPGDRKPLTLNIRASKPKPIRSHLFECDRKACLIGRIALFTPPISA